MLAYSLENLGKDKNEKNRLCIQIAGDDEEQKKIVKKLINDCGFDPYDNGIFGKFLESTTEFSGVLLRLYLRRIKGG